MTCRREIVWPLRDPSLTLSVTSGARFSPGTRPTVASEVFCLPRCRSSRGGRSVRGFCLSDESRQSILQKSYSMKALAEHNLIRCKAGSMIGEPKRGVKKAAYRAAHLMFSTRTLQLMWFDVLRLQARIRRLRRNDLEPPCSKLHLGCGSRRVAGWLNVDVIGSDYDIDFITCLPWRSDSFSAIVSQHVIEHLELFGELLPLLSELKRILQPEGQIWLSCPDMEKICRFYLDGRMNELVEDRISRDDYSLQGAPAQQIINDLFHQWGEHKNLFDFEILKWALEKAGFAGVRRVNEAHLLQRFPGFPARHDDKQTLYVMAQPSG